MSNAAKAQWNRSHQAASAWNNDARGKLHYFADLNLPRGPKPAPARVIHNLT